jgi:hypothetical protein
MATLVMISVEYVTDINFQLLLLMLLPDLRRQSLLKPHYIVLS